MFQNANPLIYMLGATASICTVLAVPTAIIEKKERKKLDDTKRKRNNNSKPTTNSKHIACDLSCKSMEQNIQDKKRERKSYFVDLTPYEVKK